MNVPAQNGGKAKPQAGTAGLGELVKETSALPLDGGMPVSEEDEAFVQDAKELMRRHSGGWKGALLFVAVAFVSIFF